MADRQESQDVVLARIDQRVAGIDRRVEAIEASHAALAEQVRENRADLIKIKAVWRAFLVGTTLGGFIIAEWDAVRRVFQ